MYKYIVYCSVSAAIIILSKYLYQHWIKQNHIISSLKQELSILTDKVKRMECEMEKNKHIFSGGVQIPITFSGAVVATPRSPSPSPSSPPKTIILLQDDISNLTLSSKYSSKSSSSSSSNSSNSSNSSASRSSKSKSSKTLDICENPAPAPSSPSSPSPPSSPPSSPVSPPSPPPPAPSPPPASPSPPPPEEKEEKEEESMATTATNTTERRKKKLPDAKQYSNGSKFKDEEANCEYLCVVGKRGGHSWKKI